MNIHKRDEKKQEDLNILLEKIYLYLRYGEIEKAFDVLDESIDENKNHYEYLVEKIKLLYMLYLKDEAYAVLDANIELLYSNIDKIDVDFISRRIYYHFYRNIELDNNNAGNNFDYLKITKEFINKYGFFEQDEKETSLQKKNAESVSLNEDSTDEVESFSSTGEYNLFGDATTLGDEIEDFEVVVPDEKSEYWKIATENNEANIFEDLFDVEVNLVEELIQETTSETLAEETIEEKTSEEISHDDKLKSECKLEQETEKLDLAENFAEETTSETPAEEIIEEKAYEEISYDDELKSKAEPEQEPEDFEEQEDKETIFAEEVVTEQESAEKEDIVVEDNPHIDEPIYLGKVNGNDVFFESMAEHVAPEKEDQSIIIIDSAQYTFTRLISLLALGFVIGAAIVYYL